MKKIIMLITLSVLGLFLGCQKEENKVASEEKIYVVGTNAEYPPYEYLENNKIVGLDADILEELSKRADFKYTWSNMNFDGLISALQTKKIDMIIAGMSISEERMKFIDFSTPYISPELVYVALKTKNLKGIEDLKNKKFGVELGTTEEESIKKIPGAEIIPFTGHTASLLALKADKIDSMLLDSAVADKYMKNNPELEIVATVSAENKAMAFNKKDSELKNKIDGELKKMLEDGTIKKLQEKYGL
ncbi:MAG: transporter substrate-binding domain-containing protein [Fusobacteriaceae bacterium]